MEENLQLECLEDEVESKLLIKHTKELALFMKSQYENYKIDFDSSAEIEGADTYLMEKQYQNESFGPLMVAYKDYFERLNVKSRDEVAKLWEKWYKSPGNESFNNI